MSEINNYILDAIEPGSESKKDITEKEWNVLNKDKLLSKIKNLEVKNKFEARYAELDSFFKQEGEQIHQTTHEDLNLFKESFESEKKSNQDIKNEFILKYTGEYKELQSDVINFLNKAFSNSLENELGDFNIDKFDKKDQKEGFSEFELEQYAEILDKAMNQMHILGSYSDFKKKYIQVGQKPDFLSWKGDIALSNSIDVQEYILGKSGKHLTDNLHNYSEEELRNMREEDFDITDSSKMKNFFILLGLEFGEGTEDVLKFIGNIGASIVVLPRYIINRSSLAISGGANTEDSVEAQMENDMLIKENPALIICELLGEKGIQMLKQLGKMMISGKNGDISMMLVTLAGLVAGGAGALKLGAKLGKFSKIEKVASKVQKGASRVDDIVGGAGIGHMTGAFSKTSEIKNATKGKEGPKNINDKIQENNLEIEKNRIEIQKNNIKLYDYVDELVENTNIKDVPEKAEIGKRAKELLTQILEDPNISPESMLILKNIRKTIVSKLGGMSIRSLNHILESVFTSNYIPKNDKVQDLLTSKFGKIDQSEFYSHVSIFHDLVKNTLPTSVVQFISTDIYGKLSTIKGGSLSSHQLESANYLRSQINSKDSKIYKTIETFLDSRGISKDKTSEYIEMMAKVIEGHGGNTEFIQVDTIQSINNIIGNIGSEFGSNEKIQGLFKGLVEKGIIPDDLSKKVLEHVQSIKNGEERVVFIRKILVQEFIKNNIGKEINFSEINLAELEKIGDVFGKINKQDEIGVFLNNKTTDTNNLEQIINGKTKVLQENKELINKYLHTNDIGEQSLEAARFSFNINDISGYVNPSTEGFTKLIMFNDIDKLVSSPLNSSLAVLSELRVAVSKETDIIYKQKLEKMYSNGFENIVRLKEIFNKKLLENVGPDIPNYFKEQGITTFGEAYNKAIEISKDIKKGTPEYLEFDKNILQYFKMEFKKMCLNSQMLDLFN